MQALHRQLHRLDEPASRERGLGGAHQRRDDLTSCSWGAERPPCVCEAGSADGRRRTRSAAKACGRSQIPVGPQLRSAPYIHTYNVFPRDTLIIMRAMRQLECDCDCRQVLLFADTGDIQKDACMYVTPTHCHCDLPGGGEPAPLSVAAVQVGHQVVQREQTAQRPQLHLVQGGDLEGRIITWQWQCQS